MCPCIQHRHSSLNDPHNFLLRFSTRNVDVLMGVHENVHLASHAELRQVNTRLDGEASPRQHAAVLARFETVHICAVTMRLLADGMAGAMAKELTITGLLDHLSRRLIDLPAQQRLPFCERLPDTVDGSIAGFRDDLEDFDEASGDIFADVARPR